METEFAVKLIAASSSNHTNHATRRTAVKRIEPARFNLYLLEKLSRNIVCFIQSPGPIIGDFLAIYDKNVFAS